MIQDAAALNDIGEAVTEMVEKLLGKRLNKNFGAPTMIVVSSKPARMPGMEMANVGTVLENMAIAATDLGIDNIIWGGAAAVIAQNPLLMAKFQIPEGYEPKLAASFGYGREEIAPRQHAITVNRI